MKKLTCDNCGSNQFRKEKDSYICEHCSTRIIQPVSYSQKKITIGITILVIVTIALIIGYKNLYTVTKDIYALSSPSSYKTRSIASFKTEIEQYKKMKNNKAFFLAYDDDGAHAYGYSSDRNTIDEAKDLALTRCQDYKSKWRVKDDCKLYALNNDIKSYFLYD